VLVSERRFIADDLRRRCRLLLLDLLRCALRLGNGLLESVLL
jgi:hypothetical protein